MMKKTILISLGFLTFINAFGQNDTTFTDSRDGKEYKIVVIGGKTWMAENLAYKPKKGEYCAYDKRQTNVKTYGYLYNWQTSMNVCPAGWHLPTLSEWEDLQASSGGQNAHTALKAKTGWDNNGTDNWGFNALPGGYRLAIDGYYFKSIGQEADFWTASESVDKNEEAWQIIISSDFHKMTYNKGLGLSVRCVKDSSE